MCHFGESYGTTAEIVQNTAVDIYRKYSLEKNNSNNTPYYVMIWMQKILNHSLYGYQYLRFVIVMENYLMENDMLCRAALAACYHLNLLI